MDTILAGDIGGTNTRLALVTPGEPSRALFSRIYASGDYESLQAILTQFLDAARAEHPGAGPRRAGLAIAGPVDRKVAKVTNLPWEIHADRVAERLEGARVRLLNDFAAVANAVPRLGPGEVHRIGRGEPRATEPIAVLGAGTGLGEAFLAWNGRRYQVITSEGGHTDFAPRNALEMRLLEHLLGRYGRVSYERVVSGRGLVNIYEFLREREGLSEPTELAEAIRAGDAAAVISGYGLERRYPICERALDLFCSLYGAEAGNLALTVLARGGVYLGGGIAAKVLPRLEAGGFRHAFENKGRFTAFLETVPTYLITHPQPGLLGAALAAMEEE